MKKFIPRFFFLNSQKLNAFLVRKIHDPECDEYVFKMAKIFTQQKCNVFLEGENQNTLMYKQANIYNDKEHEKLIDLVVTIGGDGTILHAMNQFQNRNTPPVLTFGKGTLGFMCKHNIADYASILNRVIYMMKHNMPLTIEKKSRLYGILYQSEKETFRNYYYHALNEFFISKGNNIHVPKLDLFLNDKFVTSVKGDGLIISTPNGSTGYNLSAGGPIVQNNIKAMILSPICPLSLSFRPLVLPDDIQLKLQLAADSYGNAVIMADGQVQYNFKKDDFFLIHKSKYHAKFIKKDADAPINDWLDRLQRMLHWNKGFKVKKQ